MCFKTKFNFNVFLYKISFVRSIDRLELRDVNFDFKSIKLTQKRMVYMYSRIDEL